MAKPIRHIKKIPLTEEEKRKQDAADIVTALAEHKTAVLEAIEVLQGLHDRGVLPLLNSLLAKGDEVFAILVKELNKEQNARVLENLVQLGLLLGALDLRRLQSIVMTVQSGAKEAAAQQEDRTGFKSLWKALRDPGVQRSLTLLLHALKGLGDHLPEDQE